MAGMSLWIRYGGIAYFAFAAFAFWGAMGKEFRATPGPGLRKKGTPVPTWLGRAWFIGCGLIAVYWGFKYWGK